MKTSMKRRLYDQFRRPHGPLGRVAGRIMSRRPSNIERTAWTVDLLDLPADARVLELGYGPGLGIEATLKSSPNAQVVGIDHSPTMRSMAARRNRAAVRSGRATLLVGDAQDPPADLGAFDAIFCCNVWQFWTEPDSTIERMGDLLTPNAKLAITYLPRSAAPSAADSDDAAELIEAQMDNSGLDNLTRSYLPLDPAPAVCIIGHRRRTPATPGPDLLEPPAKPSTSPLGR